MEQTVYNKIKRVVIFENEIKRKKRLVEREIDEILMMLNNKFNTYTKQDVLKMIQGAKNEKV